LGGLSVITVVHASGMAGFLAFSRMHVKYAEKIDRRRIFLLAVRGLEWHIAAHRSGDAAVHRMAALP
jgi:hypothetical protein